MPGRLGRWTVAVALLVAGCATGHQQPSTPAPSAGVAGQTDIWFMQHMVPHLWQTISMARSTSSRAGRWRPRRGRAILAAPLDVTLRYEGASMRRPGFA